VSPIDAVPRGVFVTRSVHETARLLRELFEGTLEYEEREITRKIEGIDREIKVLILVDKITKSPIRACPKDEIVRNELKNLRKSFY
jgi:hypothetical protein